jgi:16S rRNA (guanine527-N7)-methyltransferase
MTATANERDLAEILTAAGVNATLAARLAAYGALLLDANRRTNLTGAKDAAGLAAHLLDSLSLLSDITGRLVDIGSGGGLPGIPLAIATGFEVLLIEAVAKKAAFLGRALHELGLAGAVAAGRAETLAHEPRYREQFAVATARAVAIAPGVAELAVPFLRIGGRALLQRGALDPAERRAVEDAAPMLGARFVEERPLEGGRRILILEKTAPTPVRFPRRVGMAQKRPLCLIPAAR